MEATKSEDPTRKSEFEEMDPERKKFLEDVIKSLTVDVVEQLEKAMVFIADKSTSEDDLVHSLEVVISFIENIDTAKDFCKIGGLNTIIPCLKSKYENVRAKTANLIGELAQNNDYCQDELLKIEILPKLIELLTDSPKVACQGMHGISCIIRANEKGLKEFIDLGGFECILTCIQSDHERLLIKTTFLMSTLCMEFSFVKDEFIKLNALEKLIGAVKPIDEYDVQLETTLSALNMLIENEDSFRRCALPELNFKETLEKIISLNKGKEESEVSVFSNLQEGYGTRSCSGNSGIIVFIGARIGT